MAKAELPSPDLLRKLISYDPETGDLTWLSRAPDMFKNGAAQCDGWNGTYAGKLAFLSVDGVGYRQGSLLGRKWHAHRVIWKLVHGDLPTGQIDHVNGVRTDNRLCNLRAVTRSQNQQNRKRPSHNRSGVIGVSWASRDQRWVARIKADGRYMSLGHFTDKAEAIKARKAAEVEYGYHANHGRDC